MKDVDIIRSVLSATERVVAMPDNQLCERDAESLEKAAHLIRLRLQQECEEALDAMREQLTEDMYRWGL